MPYCLILIIGMLVGAGCGLLRSMYVKRECVADLIPVDMVINVMCAVANKHSTRGIEQLNIPVYNCTSGSLNPITWADIETWGLNYLRVFPYENMLWYPGGQFMNSRLKTQFYWIFTNWIPALLVDLCMRLVGKKPFLFKINKKMKNAMKALEFFATREWTWQDENMVQLWNEMKGVDQELYNFNIQSIDWKEYLKSYVLGARQFVLKEDPKTLTRCRKKAKAFLYLHQFVCFAFLLLVVLVGWNYIINMLF